MPESEFVAAGSLCLIMQNSPAHSRAEAARILLFSCFKNHLADFRASDFIRHINFFAERLNLAVIGISAVEARVLPCPLPAPYYVVPSPSAYSSLAFA